MEQALQTPAGLPPVHPDDLITDQALSSEDEDAFRLRDVADEVAELCSSVTVPATLALYGSWGSGKSSLANLLKARFADNKKIAFTRFDAFKYVELPLWRHFLSQLAGAFDVKDKAFSEGLYESSKNVKLRIPRAGWWALGVFVVAAALLMTALATISALVIALLSSGEFASDFTATLRASVPGVALGTPFVAAVLVLLGRYLTTDTTIEAPSSDEQFERLFEQLVKKITAKTGSDRLVIFIDELDRCSAPEVVTTLETLRTFLEVKSCVFIVAADQQALERALNDAARQTTPINLANPYYSAGSAYLDKIFQYQLSLPPLLPRRLSRFALDLIEGRQGVWARVPNRAELVSVLIPTHVRSPRRVKALLNSFALLFRLALKRLGDGDDRRIAERASEVAKLVCLKTEFPLFAGDLQLDHRLPALVLRLYEDPGLTDSDLRREFRGVSPEAFTQARRYAREELCVDEVIAEPAEPEPAADATETEADEVVEVEKSQARQLLRYLVRTREIPDAGRDLIYLESLGAAFGLASELAEQLEQDAVDGRIEAVERTFAELDETEQENAYRLLARAVVEAVGIEARNVVHAIFRALIARKGSLAPIADELLNAVVTYNAGYELAAEDLHGALTLALEDNGAAARRMRGVVLAREEVAADDKLALFVLGRVSELRNYPTNVATALVGLIARGQGADAAEALREAPESDVSLLVDALTVEEDETVAGLRTFINQARDQSREEVALRSLVKLVSSDLEFAGEAATALLQAFAPVTDSRLATAIVARAEERDLEDWPIWLGSLDEAAAKALDETEPALDRCMLRLWQLRFSPEAGESAPSDEEFVAAARELGRLRVAPSKEREAPDLLASASPVTTVDQAPAHRDQQAALWALVETGAFDREVAADSILADLSRTLMAAAAPPTPAEYVLEAAPPALAAARAEAVESFAQATADSPWLDGLPREVARVRTACALHRTSPADNPPPTKETLEALVEDKSALADQGLSEWITVFRPPLPAVYQTLEPRLGDGQPLPGPLQAAISEVAPAWSPKVKADLLEAIAASYVAGEIEDSVVRATGLAEAEPVRAGQTLVQSYERASNNDERQRVIALWELVDPAPDRVRSNLIDRIFIPLLGEGKVATRIALARFSLVRHTPTKAAKERLKQAIRKAVAGDKELSKRADRLMKEAGWISKKRKFLPF